jgi:hypothetical protein
LGIKGVKDVTDGLDGAAHQLRNRLGGQALGTGKENLRPAHTERVGSPAIGFQLRAFIIGQGANV